MGQIAPITELETGSAGVLMVAGRKPEQLACFGRLRGTEKGGWGEIYLYSAEELFIL